MKNIEIDGRRLWHSLMGMARIGATDKGGSCRLALSDLDRQGRDLFVRWCREAGCTAEVVQMGNIFSRRPGRDGGRPAVAIGSHLDTQPTGGKFDGGYGVLAGLVVIRTLNDQGIETAAAVEAVVWTNEEGSRFAPAMAGSGVFAGVFDLAYAHPDIVSGAGHDARDVSKVAPTAMIFVPCADGISQNEVESATPEGSGGRVQRAPARYLGTHGRLRPVEPPPEVHSAARPWPMPK